MKTDEWKNSITTGQVLFLQSLKFKKRLATSEGTY